MLLCKLKPVSIGSGHVTLCRSLLIDQGAIIRRFMGKFSSTGHSQLLEEDVTEDAPVQFQQQTGYLVTHAVGHTSTLT